MHEVLYIKVCMNFAFSDIDPLDPVEEIFKAEVHETSSRWSTKSLRVNVNKNHRLSKKSRTRSKIDLVHFLPVGSLI